MTSIFGTMKVAPPMNRQIFADRAWQIAIGTLLVGATVFFFGRGDIPRAGQSTNYAITVVPSDATALACASNLTMSGRRCGYDEQARPVGVEKPLRPFVSIGRELLLLSGVFESSSVAAWLADAQKRGDDARVTLNCYARLTGAMPRVLVRWAPEGEFQPEQNVMSAEIEDCVVQH